MEADLLNEESKKKLDDVVRILSKISRQLEDIQKAMAVMNPAVKNILNEDGEHNKFRKMLFREDEDYSIDDDGSRP